MEISKLFVFASFWKVCFLKFGNFYFHFYLCKKVQKKFGNLNDIRLELRKSRKTHSDSKTDSKVWLKVWNAGPYNESESSETIHRNKLIPFWLLRFSPTKTKKIHFVIKNKDENN